MKNWHKWIISSVNQHFVSFQDFEVYSSSVTTGKIPLFVPGQHFDSGDFQQLVWLRFDGPTLTKRSPDWGVNLTINALASSIMSDSNLYFHDELVGKVLQCFTTTIDIFQGGSVDWFCLQQESRIGIDHFGQVDITKKVTQSAVYATYKGDFDVS